jgi:DNA processing protein
MRIHLLGTGSADGWPNPFCHCASCESERAAGRSRTSSAALVDGVLLIDPGPTATNAATRAGIGLARVAHVLITHGHPDHIAAASLFPGARIHALAPEVPLVEGRAAAAGPITRWLPLNTLGLRVTNPVADGATVVIGERTAEVFAVPGPVDCRLSKGCHGLIRDGAKLVGSVDDILEELGPLFEPVKLESGREVASPAELELDGLERTIFDCISLGGAAGIAIDTVVDGSGLAASQVLATIAVLEMRRLVRRLPGSRVQRS